MQLGGALAAATMQSTWEEQGLVLSLSRKTTIPSAERLQPKPFLEISPPHPNPRHTLDVNSLLDQSSLPTVGGYVLSIVSGQAASPTQPADRAAAWGLLGLCPPSEPLSTLSGAAGWRPWHSRSGHPGRQG